MSSEQQSLSTPRTVRIEVPVLTRVEGEGALDLHVKDGVIDKLQLRIFEPPRLFEKFLEGRSYREVPDMVARICGICPVAYQMSAVHALESLFGVDPGPWVRAMRRLLYCGEWLQSHSLHIHLLAAPDFLGYESAAAMAGDHAEVVRRGLRLQGLGNELIRLLGARSVHPVGVRVGGFHQVPDPQARERLQQQLTDALPEAAELVRWTATLPLPEDPQPFTSLALVHPEEYAFNEGLITTDSGLAFPAGEFGEHVQEFHAPHSTALHASLHGKPYLVGPLARLNLNGDRLPAETRQLVEKLGIAFPSQNMFHSIIARAVELHLVMVEALRLLADYTDPPDGKAYVEVTPRAGVGMAGTEAPRGLLWHRYEMNADGTVAKAQIVPPTSQNQGRIEEDLRLSLERLGLDQPDDALRLRGETVIRNYDPCISCATHFLKLRVHRR